MTDAEESSELPERQEDLNSISETLEEARNLYQDSERRRSTIDNKTSIIITINALIIGFASLESQSSLFLETSIVLALVSLFIGLLEMFIVHYRRPGKDIDDFYQYTKMSSEDLQDELLLSYITTIENNWSKNNYRFYILALAMFLTALSVLLFAFSLLC